MTERPILFSGAMVRAILQGRKQQTRRVVTPQPEWLTDVEGRQWPMREVPWPKDGRYDIGYQCARADGKLFQVIRCPYGAASDRLWVRETHAGDNLCGWVYRADHPDADISAGELDDGEQSLRRWTPGIHMKREACRLVLDVTGVRVERLQDISEDDARAEGIDAPTAGSYRAGYALLWDSINGKRGLVTWTDNPWVWVVSFQHAATLKAAA